MYHARKKCIVGLADSLQALPHKCLVTGRRGPDVSIRFTKKPKSGSKRRRGDPPYPLHAMGMQPYGVTKAGKHLLVYCVLC